ncbi:hypothetical protein [Allobaculum mucilyticum]|uniref:hypothetical protein n=1 Tax=Allobaculum mucilyticum TaxID=2834459 RepID=UPI001E5EFC2A|nr:hypothetical protein [Allobaculum mucilyticum]UNT95183.1 hypothetical protein KWG62_07415 [Allobaculum mucilyticum]
MTGSPSTGQQKIDFNVNVYAAKIAGLKAAKAAIEAATSKIADKVAHSAAYWTGPAAIVVRAAYELLKQRLKKLAAAIDNNIAALERVVGQMTIAEATNQQSGKVIQQAVQTLKIG